MARGPHNGSAEGPNVLFIFADQLGGHYMGCYGHPDVRTPRLDALAARSTRFTRAYTTSPLCTPYRGCLFTGRYPMQTGIVANSQRMPPSEKTLAGAFNDMGYLTSYAGKWHLSGPPIAIRWVPPMERGGFEDFVGWECLHVTHYDHVVFEDDPNAPRPMPGHETDGLADIACERLKRLGASDRPFFMTVSLQAPHPICDPPREYLDLYRGRELHYRPTVDLGARFKGYGPHRVDIGICDWTEAYFGEITQLDAAVGRILDALADSGLDRNTVVLFTSDHGDMAGCHGRFEKHVMYEEATRVPLIVRMPDQTDGRVQDELFSSVDFLPTLVSLCGGAVPETAEGVDYARLLRSGSQENARENLVMQLRDRACIRRDSWKLTLDLDGEDMRELFNLASDPYEERNLVADAGARREGGRLRDEYRAWHEDARTRIGDVEEASAVSPALREG